MDLQFDLAAPHVPLQQFAMVAGAHLLALFSPGPDFFLVVRGALRHGPRKASGICLGIALGNGMFIAMALAGLAATQDSRTLFLALQWAGCAYLAWMGWRMLRASGELVLPEARPAGTASAVPYVGQVAAGFLSAALNPKNALFYASLFSLLAGAGTPLAVQAAYGVWMFVAVLAWDLLVAFGVGHPAILGRFAGSVRLVERLTGVVLWTIAVAVAANAVSGMT